ncbi:MAG: T9SS type A sorting domain-containing protein [Polaribacter sp.]|nr:T9SS type A sorting domain-containing protein [Polaribacter sp.]MBT5100033.1 T9SS type A sorting domain-containing protein [Polaribacter sp.]MBT5644774.1 T9SS type A sorting domain-containing protein [Polaribacter sp.]MBT7704670.1 T9SS type A sorting domain-containing protein [Polaribacter sp.]
MKKYLLLFFFLILVMIPTTLNAQHSIAREWNEQLLEAIRKDFARPTVHARNLFHSSVLMYDAWAIFNNTAQPIFLGTTFGDYYTEYAPLAIPIDKNEASKEIMSYAVFRLLMHRFANSPNAMETLASLETFFASLGYDKNNTSLDYSDGSYAALGNYMASKMISFGFQDGANEENAYENQFYEPVNNPLALELYENNDAIDPNRWQPLAFDVFIDQSGNPFPLNTPDFLSPEWGEVTPFALQSADLEILNNDFDSFVYNNPGAPAYIQESNENGIEDPYKWHFSLVISWSAQLDPTDDEIINISPNTIGNVAMSDFPSTFDEYKNFYNFENGGDIGVGHQKNPITDEAYEDNFVKRADYARVLAEFWADGPDSETPPGHWFTILNYVSDHPLSKKTFGNSSRALQALEWDVKSYLTLSGAMHDVAINIWGVKGYYDYIRPVSAIRYMASKGQSSDMMLPNYDPHGLPLIEDLIAVITEGDALAGSNNQHLGKIKVKSWKGPDFINDPEMDIAGVDWILGTRWWPYQRPSFVTPPFAGYLSGHSAFSRAASEVLTLITNDAFFPGGIGVFDVAQNDFLVFEQGPTESFSLQWATYRDASDQTSLSRIWGGIHPPIDDIRGRIIGDKIGKEAFNFASTFFSTSLNVQNETNSLDIKITPNPIVEKLFITTTISNLSRIDIYNVLGVKVFSEEINTNNAINISNLKTGVYFVKINSSNEKLYFIKKIIKSN